MEHLQIITTADGSHSLINTSLNETYHSRHGARQESMHVFIRNGLDHYREVHSPRLIRVLEVGFGSGLNALLAIQWAGSSFTNVHYSAIEPYPLPEAIWRKLNYVEGQDKADNFRRLHELPWGIDHALRPGFIFRKELSTIQHCSKAHESIDVIFYDAFAPDKQPEMWTPEVMVRVTDMLAMKGVLVTYCAKGQVKRTLKTLGMIVESLPGAPGKKEMTRATKGSA